MEAVSCRLCKKSIQINKIMDCIKVSKTTEIELLEAVEDQGWDILVELHKEALTHI